MAKRLDPEQIEPGTDGQVLTTVAGESVWGAGEATALVPLTTVIDGVPDLVWDDDNQLVLTEVPR